MHWQDLPPSPLRDALYSAGDPHLLTKDGTINLYNPWVEVEVGRITNEARSWFLYGHCGVLALALHDLTNYPLVLVK